MSKEQMDLLTYAAQFGPLWVLAFTAVLGLTKRATGLTREFFSGLERVIIAWRAPTIAKDSQGAGPKVKQISPRRKA